MSDMGIYKITNTVNGKVYIGQSTRLSQRLDEHQADLKNNRHHNQHLQNSYNKYGDVFEIEIIEYCDDESELDDLERYYITHYNSMNPQKGYNKENGGNLNKHLSEETRKKISKSMKGENNPMYGQTHSAEARKKISETHKGTTLSAETRKKISENNARYWQGKTPWNKGKTHSTETRKKMSENSARYWQGKTLSAETRKKISENNARYWQGKTRSAETRKKISEKISEIHNTSGFYRVSKKEDNSCKQNFLWCYRYYINDKRKEITSTNLLKLKAKVKAQGLPWEIIDEKKAQKSLELNNKYHKGEYK